MFHNRFLIFIRPKGECDFFERKTQSFNNAISIKNVCTQSLYKK